MLNSLTLMLAFLTDNEIWIFPFKNIVDDTLFTNLHKIMFKFIHESVEKLIDIHLDAWIYGLSIQDKGIAEWLRGIYLSVGIFEVGENFLNLICDVFFVLDRFWVYFQQRIAEFLNMVELLEQRIDIAGSCQIFQPHLCAFISFFEAFYVPFMLLSPCSFCDDRHNLSADIVHYLFSGVELA